jgi:hypothetical protein
MYYELVILKIKKSIVFFYSVLPISKTNKNKKEDNGLRKTMQKTKD